MTNTKETSAGKTLELPEHEKLKLVKDRSQSIYDFLEWCAEQGMALASYGEERGYRDTLFHVGESREQLLARFFEIDLDKLENEKRAIIEEMRAFSAVSSSNPSQKQE